MRLYFDGELTYKAYYDPDTSVIDVISNAFEEEGRSDAFGGGLNICVDDEDNICSLSLDLAGDTGEIPVGDRPEEAPEAYVADVEVVREATPRYRFDPSAGTLRMAFGDLDSLVWARLKRNLIWLGIDDDSRLASMVVEGISRDPGGKAQAAWLQEMAGRG